MDFKRSLLQRLYRRLLGRDLFAESRELDEVAQLLYRRILKHVHRSYSRELLRQAKTEVG